jgi:hypothetical protein
VLSRLAEGVAVIYSCAGPAYPRWVTDWPPLAAALLRAAETSGALLVTTGNLYGYGAVGLRVAPTVERRPPGRRTVCHGAVQYRSAGSRRSPLAHCRSGRRRILYLVGGAPRVGKSVLAQRRLETEGIPWLPTDVVRTVLRRVLPELEAADQDPVDAAQLAEFMYPHVEQVAEVCAEEAERFLIEGFELSPWYPRAPGGGAGGDKGSGLLPRTHHLLRR